MIQALESHITIRMECDKCGRDFEIYDYDSMSTEQAERRAEEVETCPNCEGMD